MVSGPDKIRGWFRRESWRPIRHGRQKENEMKGMVLPERREHVATGEKRSIDGSKHGRQAVGETTVLIR